MIRDQQRSAYTLIASGNVNVNIKDKEYDADILMVGVMEPLTMKVEITHAWGRPLFHVLVSDMKLQIVSFQEKRFYRGTLKTAAETVLLLEGLEPEQIWAIFRGYPALPVYSRAVSSEGNRITLYKGKDEVLQHIEVYPNNHFPLAVTSPDHKIKISFSDFAYKENILYAKKRSMLDQKEGSQVKIEIKETIFNQDIPETIFDLEIPPDFKWFRIKKEQTDN